MVVYTLYRMSERSAAARICGCSLVSLSLVCDARLTRSSLFRVLNSRINTIVAGAKQITAIPIDYQVLCATIWCFLFVFESESESLAWVNH